MVDVSLGEEVAELRGKKNRVEPFRAVSWLEERENDGSGATAEVLTCFLAAAQCPWRCTMCDLWKNTLEGPTPRGAIPRQIASVIGESRFQGEWIKLYNSGSFFDRKSIPPGDLVEIARLCEPYKRVIVENHPRLCGPAVIEFQQQLSGQLEVALGVETVQPGMLRRLNKGMDRTHVDRAIDFLVRHAVDVRAFVLVGLPWNFPRETIPWTILTIKHLQRLGVRHISLIPLRLGNGWMERLAEQGQFHPPAFHMVEELFGRLLEQRQSSVITLDLWDWPRTAADCPCLSRRYDRLAKMNLQQRLSGQIVACPSCQRNDPYDRGYP